MPFEPAEVPVLEDLAGRVGLDEARDDLLELLVGDVGHVAALEDLAPVLVDHPALLVHDVVVLEHALADQEVLLLDLLLRVLDRLREHLRLERVLLALLVDRAEPVEDLVDPLAGEEPDQVVLGGEEEARLARVALAAGAAAKLVVDPPRLVALGAADEEAAELADLVPFGGGLLLEPLGVLGQLGVPALVAGLDAELAELVDRDLLGVAAELDVDAAARHVGRDRDRAEAARLGDGLALALGVLGLRVQDRVLDAVALQLVGEHLGDLDRDRPDEHRLALLVALA